jgi:hypothetical protein
VSQPSDDGRSALARGMVWGTQISSLGLELAVPILVGYWCDRQWGTWPWLLLLGMGLGIYIFTWGVIRLGRDISKKP